jgi:hypothetical protein
MCDNALLSAFARNQKTVSGGAIEEIARDLRLGCEVQQSQADATPSTVGSVGESESNLDRQPGKALRDSAPKRVIPNFEMEDMLPDVFELEGAHGKREPKPIVGKPTPRASQQSSPRTLKFAFATFLMFFGVIAIASLIEPKNFLGAAGKTMGFAKHNLHQWFLFVTNEERVPRDNIAEEVTFEPEERRITIPRGSSVYQLAVYTYGPNSNLGVDLIKEFNPDIKNLSRVSAGQSLVLPPLTLENLLRKQIDGSYHLILASIPRQIAADEYATRLRAKGYTVTITPKRISDELLLHRVGISGLKTFGEANQTWLTALRNGWLVLPDNNSELARAK